MKRKILDFLCGNMKTNIQMNLIVEEEIVGDIIVSDVKRKDAKFIMDQIIAECEYFD